jgi:hypothetical protein
MKLSPPNTNEARYMIRNVRPRYGVCVSAEIEDYVLRVHAKGCCPGTHSAQLTLWAVDMKRF